jgi:putative heme-binding domain-containing protein
MPDLDLSYRKEGDPHLRPLKADRFSPSWVPDAKPPRAPAASARPRTAPGNIARGREVFFGKEARCAVCHSIRGEGGKVAPDLTPSSERDPDAVLRDIVDPNGAINPDFVTYLIELSDGSILTGVLLAQDAERIVLVDAEGKEHALARPRIRQFRSSALSLMPEGFKNLGEDALRDLVAFLCAPDPGRK